MQGVVCGPGGRYNTTPNERVDIADYLDMVRIYLLTMLEICEAALGPLGWGKNVMAQRWTTAGLSG